MKTRLLLPFVALIAFASPLLAGPPWITVELPPNPFDRASRGAFLLVHAFHYSSEGSDPVVGRAVGVVDGQRRNLTLGFEPTSRPGVYALKNTWGDKGEWALVITNRQEAHGGGAAAEVMVRVSGGRVIGVEAATKPSNFAELPLEPRRFTEVEIEASLGRGAR